MSAPTLTPDERIRSAAFFEADDFAKIIEHHDDDPICVCKIAGIACTSTATHAMVCTTCGGLAGLLCGAHAAWLPRQRWHRQHVTCGALKPICELIRVVPL